MKLNNAGIFFILIFLGLIVKTDVKERLLVAITNQKIQLDCQLDNAIDDAMEVLTELDSANNIVVNRESAVEHFYKSLYANLGILDSSLKKELISVYIPIIVITDIDGFYIQYKVIEDGEVKNVWSNKIPYSIEKNGIIYSFFLGDKKGYIRIFEQGEWKEGEWKELLSDDKLEIFQHFENNRRQVIIDILQSTMQLYINEHNKIASEFGISYEFRLPEIENDDWIRTVDDISMVSFFQGYPYGTSRTMVYNRYTVSGARIYKK